jgi:dienelactone hydrolase
MRWIVAPLVAGLCIVAPPAFAKRPVAPPAKTEAAPAQPEAAPPKAEAPMAVDLAETVTDIPMTVRLLDGKPYGGRMIITHFKPRGDGPFPAVIINHGRAQAGHLADTARFRYLPVVRYWTSRGFAVIVPTRLGYGDTGTQGDPEFGGKCDHRNHGHSAAQAATQAIAAVKFAQGLPFVVADKIIMAGTSMGGLTTVYASSRDVPGLVGFLNFAGGVGGNPETRPGNPCDSASLKQVYAIAGKSPNARKPMLWLYSENDLYWGTRLPKEWHAAFVAGGAPAEFVPFPPVGTNGHRLMTDGGTLWHPIVDAFLVKLGFTLPAGRR